MHIESVQWQGQLIAGELRITKEARPYSPAMHLTKSWYYIQHTHWGIVFNWQVPADKTTLVPVDPDTGRYTLIVHEIPHFSGSRLDTWK